MMKERYFDTIVSPVITEKATLVSEQNKVVFEVAPGASKTEIKESVEKLFGVKVTKVNTVTVHDKTRRFRGVPGKKSGYRKAVVTLAEGQTINLAGGI